MIEDDRNRRAVIIEVKRSRNFDDVETDSENAIRQIRKNNYAWPYQCRKYTVLAYGIAFVDKDCGVKVEKRFLWRMKSFLKKREERTLCFNLKPIINGTGYS